MISNQVKRDSCNDRRNTPPSTAQQTTRLPTSRKQSLDNKVESRNSKLQNQKNDYLNNDENVEYDQRINMKLQSNYLLKENIIPKDLKWKKFKILGPNIQSRSRGSINLFQKYLYIYGGYDQQQGILKDFWRLQILKKKHFIWEKVEVKNSLEPGNKARHTSFIYKNNLYIFGGQHQFSQSSNDLWQYNFDNQTWALKYSNKQEQIGPQCIDSHNIVIKDNKMIVLFGYLSNKGLYSNAVYEMNLETFCWNILHPNFEGNPCGRAESSACFNGKNKNQIYFFGGTDGYQRYNDLGYFDLEKNCYQMIQFQQGCLLPKVRSGHQMVSFSDNKLLVFGGIYEVTWELDDLFVFDIDSHSWIIIDADNTRNTEESTPIYIKKILKSEENTLDRKNLCHINDYNECFGNTKYKSPQKNEMNQKKKTLLKQLEVDNPDEFVNSQLSPITEKIKNSLNVIGNPDPRIQIKPGKLTSFGKTTHSRFLDPVNDQVYLKKGKKPCARDGHQIEFLGNNKFIVFGGDRHNISFNDIYLLNMNKIQKEDKTMYSKTN